MRVRLHPSTEQDRQLVRNELAEVLRTPHFTHSKRYPALLTYIVERSLEGLAGDLKERTLGVEVFHRKPDYDNNDDTIVRFTAGEVRKRLALVYHESSSAHAVQIELPVGSYAPEFFQLVPEPSPAERTEFVPSPGEDAHTMQQPVSHSSRRRVWLALMFLFLTLVATAATLMWREHNTQIDSLTRFWKPVQNSVGPVILCPGAMVFSSTSPSKVTKAQKTDEYPYISVATAGGLANVVALLARTRTGYTIQPSSAITLTNMREHPVVLLGAYNNEWSLRLINTLRFRFSDEPNLQIYDSQNPKVVWARPTPTPYRDADDYAIVARYRDKLTDNNIVIVGGIGKNATEAAAEFVTSSRYLDLLDRPQSKDWTTKNVEFVIKIKVIDGKTGPPSIEAVYVW